MINKSPNNDKKLVSKALEGDKKSLEALLAIYKDYIYNIALRLFLNPDDALDATQDVLIKVITNLKSFRSESKFSSWIYSIAVNHFLTTRARKSEQINSTTQHLGSTLVSVEDEPQRDEAVIEEMRIMCSTAMLMCLNREQRLLYIIGEIFEADHQLGSELFGISKQNYRTKLHRARKDLQHYVAGKCGLIDPTNECRCPKKATQFMRKGLLDSENLRFNNHYRKKISKLVHEKKDEINDYIQLELQQYFQDSPFQVKKELDQLLSDLC